MEKFIVPQKNEAWRFSTLKEIDVASGPISAATVSSKNAEVYTQGEDVALKMPQSLALPFFDFGSRPLEQMTVLPKFGFTIIKAPQEKQSEVELHHESLREGGQGAFRSLVEVEPKAIMDLREFLKLANKEAKLFSATRVKVSAGATLNYVVINDLPKDAKNFNFIEIVAEAGASVNVTIMNLGSGYTRQEVTAILKGEGASVNLRSLSVAGGDTEIDQRTLQIHEAANAKSDLLFKNVLEGRARSIFSGMIRVAEGAQKTDAYQKNRNLILSDEAQANSLPGLEIGANDVRCTHGATVGNLNEEELFYLQARGIERAAAQRMLIGGYCEEIIANLPQEVAVWARGKLV